jgi:hypothetical protein
LLVHGGERSLNFFVREGIAQSSRQGWRLRIKAREVKVPNTVVNRSEEPGVEGFKDGRFFVVSGKGITVYS